MSVEPINNGDGWVRAIAQRAEQYSILFVHAGSTAPGLAELLRMGLVGYHIDSTDFLRVGATGFEDVPTGIVVVSGVEKLARRGGRDLGPFRAGVMSLCERGASIVLLSKSPKCFYPETIGSDVIADAKQAFAPLELFEKGIDDEDLRAAICELGDSCATDVSDAMWGNLNAPREVLQYLSRSATDALRGAGMVEVAGDVLRWSSLLDYKRLRSAFSRAASEVTVVADHLAEAYTDLWRLERLLRNLVRAALIAAAQGDWRGSSVSGALAGEVVDRSKRDSNPAAISLAHVRDPLEWLTLSELLDLRERRELGGLGLDSFVWMKIRHSVLPIRNKVAHMRVMNEYEAREVKKWLRVVEARVG